MKLGDWLEVRTGWRGALHRALHEPVPGGASFAYVFGSVLVFLLLLQMVTGVLLAFYYAPTATDAWASVAHLERGVTMGWLVRGLHHHGASAMVIVCGLHLMQTALYGAYKKPREVNWIVGVLLLGLILAFALTGYLLPWDQTGYWATKVATGIAGETPLLGAQVQQALQGGNEYGNLTLTRFYALHVFVLPALTIGLVALHVALFRRHGVTPSWRRSDAELRARVSPFWPDQLFKDVVAMAVAFAALLGWVVHEGGAGLDAPADPSSNFDARPEWYFRPLFQLLKYFEGPMQTVAALGVPAIVGAVLLGLPFLDRAQTRCPLRRKLPLGLVAAGVVGAGVLTMLSFRQDAADPQLAEREAASVRQAALALDLAERNGVPAAGGTAVFETAPFHRARTLWARECAGCHDADATDRKGPVIGPGYNSRAWIRGFLADPRGEAFFKHTRLGAGTAGMDPVEVEPAVMDALVELIYAQTGADDVQDALALQGKVAFTDEGCTDCHRLERPVLDPKTRLEVVADAGAPPAPAPAAPDDGEVPEGEDGEETEDEAEELVALGAAPVIEGRGSPEWLVEMILRPYDPLLFADKNEMDPFLDRLGPDDAAALAEWITWLRTATQDDLDRLPPL